MSTYLFVSVLSSQSCDIYANQLAACIAVRMIATIGIIYMFITLLSAAGMFSMWTCLDSDETDTNNSGNRSSRSTSNNRRGSNHHRQREFANDCSICLEECRNANSWTRLPCGHRFHLECLKLWVSSKKNVSIVSCTNHYSVNSL